MSNFILYTNMHIMSIAFIHYIQKLLCLIIKLCPINFRMSLMRVREKKRGKKIINQAIIFCL